MIMLFAAVAAFLSRFTQTSLFGILSENVTFKLRKNLYSSILSKNFGWFDGKDHTPGVLTANLA